MSGYAILLMSKNNLPSTIFLKGVACQGPELVNIGKSPGTVAHRIGRNVNDTRQ